MRKIVAGFVGILGLGALCAGEGGGAYLGAMSLLPLGMAAAPTFYVSTTGSNSNPGTHALPWRTITYAVGSSSPAPASSTIYIQAGDYGNENVVVRKDGLKLIGYHAKPGDQAAILVKSMLPIADFEPTHQPLLRGANRSSGIAINLQGRAGVTVSNINITNYSYGISAGSTNQNFKEGHTISNVNVSQLGNPTVGYSGLGISLGSMGTRFSNGCTVRNCMIVNAAAEGLSINGDQNTADNVKVFNLETEGAASTDYYVLICGNYNLVLNSMISRAAGSSHNGHGFSIKSNAEQIIDEGQPYPVINPQFNVIRNCVAYNLGESFVVRHRGVRNNTFIDNRAFGAGSDSNCEGNGIVIRDGASDNKFINTTVQNACSGIRFNDTTEDGDTGANPPGHPGSGNLIDGISVRNTYYGFNFHSISVPSDAGANTVRNSTFDRVRYVFGAARSATAMTYQNITFNGTLGILPPSVGGFRTGPFSGTIVPSQFSNCSFTNIAGGMPPGF